jgi:hypothetical protein
MGNPVREKAFRQAIFPEVLIASLVLLQLALIDRRYFSAIDLNISNLLGVAALLLWASCATLSTRKDWGLAVSLVLNFGVFVLFLRWILALNDFEEASGYSSFRPLPMLLGDPTHFLGSLIVLPFMFWVFPTKILFYLDARDSFLFSLSDSPKQFWRFMWLTMGLYLATFPVAYWMVRTFWKLPH